MKKSLYFYFAVLFFSIIISIPLLIPYLHPGYFPTHDGEWAIVRLSDMFREVRDFQIPPRYSGNLNFGYGYPLFNFAYPMPYYIGLVIHMLGIGFVSSIKLVFALSIPVSAFFMFLASRNIWKNDNAGIISAVLYLYFPYRLVDLFVRGSIGESVGFALLPIILFCLSKLMEKPRISVYAIAGAFSYSALILSHNIMSVLFTMSLFIFFVGNFITKKYKIINSFLFVLTFGFILSAFFWIPALIEKNNILLSRIPIAERNLYFVEIKQLLFGAWGYGVPTDKVHGFSYQLGWPFFVIIGILLAVFIYQFYKKKKIDNEQALAITILVGALFLSLFLFPLSKTIWKLPLLSEINYPWIMLSQLGLLLSLLGGYLVKFKYTKVIVFSTAIFALILYIPLAKPSSYIDYGDNYYFTNDATTTSSRELMPVWVKTFPFQRYDQKVEILSGNGKIENLIFNSKKLSFSLQTTNETQVRINTIYYPGWKIKDNNQIITLTHDNKFGVMDVKLSKGTHNIVASFSETKVRLISDLVSLAGLLFAGFLFVKLLIMEALKNDNS